MASVAARLVFDGSICHPNGCEFACLHDLGWCVLRDGEVLAQLAEKPIASLVLVEMPISLIKRQVYSPEDAPAFPFEMAVRSAVAQGDEYWVSRAIEWVVDALDLGMDWPRLVIAEVRRVSGHRWYSQELRAAARRLQRQISQAEANAESDTTRHQRGG